MFSTWDGVLWYFDATAFTISSCISTGRSFCDCLLLKNH